MKADAFDRVRVGVRNVSASEAADVLDEAMDLAAEEAARAADRCVGRQHLRRHS